jgi:plastocyanin
MRRPLPLLVLLLAALALAVAGCGGDDNKDSGSSSSTTTDAQPAGGGSGGTTAGGTVEVSMKNIEYVPKAVTAKVGQTIHWTNGDSVAHTVTSEGGASFDSGVMDPGKEFSFKVTKAGTINYMCQIHPNQKGTIVVQ